MWENSTKHRRNHRFLYSPPSPKENVLIVLQCELFNAAVEPLPILCQYDRRPSEFSICLKKKKISLKLSVSTLVKMWTTLYRTYFYNLEVQLEQWYCSCKLGCAAVSLLGDLLLLSYFLIVISIWAETTEFGSILTGYSQMQTVDCTEHICIWVFTGTVTSHSGGARSWLLWKLSIC